MTHLRTKPESIGERRDFRVAIDALRTPPLLIEMSERRRS